MLNRRSALKTTAAGLAMAAWPMSARAQAEAWTRGPDLPIPLQEIYGTVHEGEIWIAGGLTPAPDGGVAISDRCIVLNPETMNWRDGPRLREPTHHPQLVSADGALFLIGGFRADNGGGWSMRDDFEMLRDGEWRQVASLPLPLAETHASVLDGKIHLAGGRTTIGGANADWQDHTDTDLHLIFDLKSGKWSEGPPLLAARNSGAAATLEGKFYVIGGRTVADGNSVEVHRFDPETGGWMELPPLPQARGGIAATASEQAIFVFGGEYFDTGSGDGVFDSVLAFDFESSKWAVSDPMPTPRHGLTAVAIADQIWTIGGAINAGASGTSAKVEIFNLLFFSQLRRI